MTRSLTAYHPRPKGGATAPFTLGTALLAASLLLASCGGPSAPPAATAPGTGTNTAGRAALSVTASTPVLTTNLNAPTQLRVAGVAPADVTVQVTGAPESLTVKVGAGVADGAATVLPLTVTGTAPEGTAVQMNVTAGGRAASLTLPVTAFERVIIPASSGEAYAASSIGTGRGGQLTLVASPNGAASAEVRHSLLHFDPAARTLTAQAVNIAQDQETILSHAVTPDGTGWVSVSATSARGVSLINLRTQQTFRPGVPDLPSRLNVTPDGSLWFMAPSVSALVRLNPAGTITRVPMDPGAEWLTAGADGRLYLGRSGAAPAILALNPVSGEQNTYPVTLVRQSQPGNLTAAPDGTLWFIEGTTSTVVHLDPRTQKQTPLTLPGTDPRPSRLAALPDGTVWVMDGREKVLHRIQGGRVTLTLPLPRDPAGQVLVPDALGGTADSRLVFTAGGALYLQQ